MGLSRPGRTGLGMRHLILPTLGAGLIVAVLVAVWLGQRRLIYYPDTRPAPDVVRLEPRATAVSIVTEDGVRLGAWFVPSSGEPAMGSVLVLHGNAGQHADRLPLAIGFARRGMSVLLVGYRGYGGNPGRPTEEGLIRDARAAQDWLASRPDVDPQRIVYFGESLGAAVAVALAVERPPAALVLRSPFTSLVDVGRVHFPWLPVGWLLRDRYPSIDRIRGVDCPVLVIAGERDSIVPVEQSRRVFEAATHAAKKFVSIPEADHNDPALTAGDSMLDDIVGFVSEQHRRM